MITIDKVNKLKEMGFWYFYLVSLFSAETLIDAEACRNSLNTVEELEKLFGELSEEDVEIIKNAKEIILRDLNEFDKLSDNTKESEN